MQNLFKVIDKIARSKSYNSSLLRRLQFMLRAHKRLGVRFLTRLKISFNHLRKRKFKHNFQETFDLLCNCRLDIETTANFFLHCHKFMHKCIDNMFILNKNLIIDVLLFENSKYSF